MFDVSNRIKELRINRGLTVNGLANLAGISQSYLREIELGNKKPTIEYLEYICDALNISLVAFVDVNNNDEISETRSVLNKKQKGKRSEFIKSLFL